MVVEVFPRNCLSQFESQGDFSQNREALEKMNISDDQLRLYDRTYFEQYRATAEEFFPEIMPALVKCAHTPFHTDIVRLGPNGVIIGHRRSSEASIEVRRADEFDPPFVPFNILDVIKRLQFEHCYVSFTVRTFSESEARTQAVQDALQAVLECFWITLDSNESFVALVKHLLEAEELTLLPDVANGPPANIFNAHARVMLNEPGGFRRFEEWGIIFRHRRVSATELRSIEAQIEEAVSIDAVCLITDDELTSIGRFIASESPKLRVWSRDTLNSLIVSHPETIKTHFAAFPEALHELSSRIWPQASVEVPSRHKEFLIRLQKCPPGKEHFAEYESIGIDLLQHVFKDKLGPAAPQSRTSDDKQRRDVVFRNNRQGRFFDRCFHRFAADSIIVDFKNYADPVGSGVVTDVEKYANKAIGKFILVISRKGASDTVGEAQIRAFRDSGTIIVVVSDNDLLEMINRLDQKLVPEDVIEDRMDELLRSY